MACIDATLVQQVVHLAKRERDAHAQHHGVADDPGAGTEVAEAVWPRRHDTLCSRLVLLKVIDLAGPH